MKSNDKTFSILSKFGMWSQEDLLDKKEEWKKKYKDSSENMDNFFSRLLDQKTGDIEPKDLIFVRFRKKPKELESSLKREVKESETVDIPCNVKWLQKCKFIREATERIRNGTMLQVEIEGDKRVLDLSQATSLNAGTFQKIANLMNGKKSIIHEVNTSANKEAIADFRKAVLFLSHDDLGVTEKGLYVSIKCPNYSA